MIVVSSIREIEHTLDHLLDCACIPEGLALFKSLCRHYYGINLTNTASYVQAYREMWDTEADLAGEIPPESQKIEETHD